MRRSLLPIVLTAALATQQANAQALSSLPAALSSAMQSANAQAIHDTIDKLAAGNDTKRLYLAALTASVAATSAPTSPAMAVAGIVAAAGHCRNAAIPGAKERCELVIQHGTAVVQGIPYADQALAAPACTALFASTGNPALKEAMAAAVMACADLSGRLATTRTEAAIALAGAALAAVEQTPMPAPAMAGTAAASAMSVAAFPLASRSWPAISADFAVRALRLMSNPATFRENPPAAMQTLALSMQVLRAPGVASAAPRARGTAAQLLRSIAASDEIRLAYPNIVAEVENILRM